LFAFISVVGYFGKLEYTLTHVTLHSRGEKGNKKMLALLLGLLSMALRPRKGEKKVHSLFFEHLIGFCQWQPRLAPLSLERPGRIHQTKTMLKPALEDGKSCPFARNDFSASLFVREEDAKFCRGNFFLPWKIGNGFSFWRRYDRNAPFEGGQNRLVYDGREERLSRELSHGMFFFPREGEGEERAFLHEYKFN